MAKTSSSVRIKVVRTNGSQSSDGASRETFWQPLRESTDNPNGFAIESEGRFRREFGNHLRDSLIEMFDSAMRNSEFRDFERFWMHWGPSSERSQYFADAVSRWIEARQQEFADSPALRAARENRVLARQVCFTVSRISYSSLLFDLDFGPVEKVAAIFDNNFDSFQVFLNAFVPVAFGESTTDSFANLHTYEIDASDDARRAFAAARPSAAPQPQAAEHRSTAQGTREKAEWLWKLANGSLLIPVLIGLIVMLYAVRELAVINRYQQEQMKPILEHHLELLKEDRLRLQEQRTEKPEPKPATAQPQPANPAAPRTP